MTAVKKAPAGTTRSVPAKKAAPAKKTATRATAKKAPAKRAAAAKKAAPRAKAAPARKSATKASAARSAATRAPARKSAATKASTRSASAKSAATRAPAKKSAAKVPATKASAAKAAAGKAPAGKAAASKTTAAAKAPVKKAPAAPKRPTVGPYAKDGKFLDAQRVLLLEERGIYAGQAVDLRAEADSLALEREPGDVQFDEESGEGGTVTVDRERNLALSAQASLAVEEIDDALTKLDRKTYGYCERCFRPIPKARLQALPFARLCVSCKSGGLSRR